MGELLIYEGPGDLSVQVRLEGDTVWLTQRQMAELFGTSSDNVGVHLQNIFADEELSRAATTEEFSVVQTEGRRRVTRSLVHYNLDAILSVGYRVSSQRGTQFRIWATRTLREHLLRGYTINEPRVIDQGLHEIQQAVALLGKTLRRNDLVAEDGRAVLDIIESYTNAWHLLPAYDADRLSHAPHHPREPASSLTLREARAAIRALRIAISSPDEPMHLFGLEHSQQLAGILGAIEQTFDALPIYPSAQSRAAHLLYFVVKDHPFADGNKRIGALLFLEYLQRNGLLRASAGAMRLDANAVVALTLLIAESDPRQKNLMIRLVLGMLEDRPAHPDAGNAGRGGNSILKKSTPAGAISQQEELAPHASQRLVPTKRPAHSRAPASLLSQSALGQCAGTTSFTRRRPFGRCRFSSVASCVGVG